MLVTVEQFLERPERTDGWQEELIDGEVVVSSNAKKRHIDVSANVYDLLLPLKQSGFTVIGEMACRLSPHSLPNTDAAVMLRERWAAVPDDDFPREAPALAVEVHSPSNTTTKLLRKVQLYLEGGAEECWVIYPKARKVTVYLRDGRTEERREGETLSFSGCTFQVSDVFAAR